MMFRRFPLLAITLCAMPVAAQRVPQGTRAAVRVMSGGDGLFVVPRTDPGDAARDLKVLGGGAIAVLKQKSVHVFDASGRLFSVIGGFIDASSIDVDGAHLTVRDIGAGVWKTVALDGKPLASRPISSSRRSVTRWPMRGNATLIETVPALPKTAAPLADDTLFVRTVSIQVGSAEAVRLFDIRVDSLYFRAGYDSVEFQSQTVRNAQGLFVPMPSRFGASGAWTLRGDSVVIVADGTTGEITWYTIGHAGAIVSARGQVGRTARALSTEDIQNETARLHRIAVSAAPSRYHDPKHVSQPLLVGAPKVHSVATRALIADDGALWVGVNRIYADTDPTGKYLVRAGDDNTWTVFPQERAAFLVTLPPRFRLTAIRDGRLYGFTDSEAGIVVEVYAVAADERR